MPWPWTRGETSPVQKWFYEVVTSLSKTAPPWVVEFMVWMVSTGFFLFSPERVRVSMRFYRELFPDRGRFFPLGCAWRQYHNFSHIFLDRLRLRKPVSLTYTSEGWEDLEAVHKEGKGGIILMSHLGNWEIAAHLLKTKSPEMNLLLYMGVKQKDQIEHVQKQSLTEGGVKIVGIDRDGGSPFAIIEGLRMLKEGGFVSMTGDVLWNQEQRTVHVRFLGHKVKLPAAPHILALLSGAPLFVFFAFRVGRGEYRFKIIGPKYVRMSSRSRRTEAIQGSAQEYAHLLEQALYQSPLEWYHFEPFLEPQIAG
jgi:predicted LPLAT superfamily acyltransferase